MNKFSGKQEDAMPYQHIFGPVLSRRLGVSLGVDLVTHKICSMDCVYCECGKTTNLTLERKEYVRFKDVVNELNHYFQHQPDPAYITFSGSGEPTLNSQLGRVIAYLKSIRPHIKVAVLTNSSLFSDPGVRQELMAADLVVPSLDAVGKESFQRINRPGQGIDIHEIIAGIELFAREYTGRIWLEIFILPGFNDTASDFQRLKEAVHRINPHQVQINTLDRPGTLSNIRPATLCELEAAVQALDFPATEIIAKLDDQLSACLQRDDIKAAILATIHRRPSTREDLQKTVGAPKKVIDDIIAALEKEAKIIGKSQARGVFYQTIKERTP